MRKFLVDTDTGSDDAVALMMAALNKDIELVGVTTVSGNVGVDQATANALMTLEVCDSNVEIYKGLEKPLFKELVHAMNVHGDDGMGDLNLINPTKKANDKDAVDFIIEMAKKYPNELEIVMIGPATNIATAILKDRQAMEKVKHIYSMGTGGFGLGNCTPVSEFNVYADAEAYRICLESKIDMTIIGFDVCIDPNTVIYEDMMNKLRMANKIGKFAMDCNTGLLNYNIRRSGGSFVDLCDAVAMAVALYPEVVTDEKKCFCSCHTDNDECYGQVIVYDLDGELVIDYKSLKPNATLIKSIDAKLYKDKLIELICNH